MSPSCDWLSSVFLDTNPPDADLDNVSVSLLDLEKALETIRIQLEDRKTTLERTVQENQSNFANYIQKVQALERTWRPLGQEHLQRHLYGDEREMAIRSLSAQLRLVEDQQEGIKRRRSEEAYLEHLGVVACRKAHEIAKLPDYEKTRVEFKDAPLPGENKTAKVCTIISQKTKRMAEFLKELTRCIVEVSSNEGSPAKPLPDENRGLLMELPWKTCQLYLETFKASFAAQLEQIPHLAALFYNDCFYLSALCSLQANFKETPQLQSRKLNIEMTGSITLQNTFNRELDNLGEILAPGVWRGNRYGQLDGDVMTSVARCMSQAQLKLGQLVKVLSPILDQPIFASFMFEMAQFPLVWLWNGVLSLKSVTKDSLAPLGELFETVLRVPMETLGSRESDPQTIAEFRKLSCLLRISRQNLIQVSNAFRREEYHREVTLEELKTIVNILFPNTAMKEAFLDEITADMQLS